MPQAKDITNQLDRVFNRVFPGTTTKTKPEPYTPNARLKKVHQGMGQPPDTADKTFYLLYL